MNKRNIRAYRISDHGIMLVDLSPGRGMRDSEFSHCVNGCGINMADAMEHCLQQMNRLGINTVSAETRMLLDMGYDVVKGWPTEPSVLNPLTIAHRYYVSIDYDLDPISD